MDLKLEQPQLTWTSSYELLAESVVCVATPTTSFLLHGAVFPALVPLLDGNRHIDDILDVLEPRFTAALVFDALLRLEDCGLLASEKRDIPSRKTVFGGAEFPSLDAPDQLGIRGAGLLSLSDVGTQETVNHLMDMGVLVGADQSNLLIVLADDYEDPRLSEVNREALSCGRPWLLVKPRGQDIWLGPLFRPGVTACWNCLEHRLRYNRQTDRLRRVRDSSRKATLPVLAISRVALSLTSAEAVRFLALGSSPLENRIAAIGLGGLVTAEHHTLTRRPQCPVCGEGQCNRKYTPDRFELSSRPVGPIGSDLREFSAESTLSAYGHHVSSICGVVPFLRELPVAGGDDLVFNVYSGSTFHMKGKVSEISTPVVRSFNSGKGDSLIQARAGALCEALERYCWIYDGTERLVAAAFSDFSDKALYPPYCTNYSDRQYDLRDETNRNADLFSKVPQRFDASRTVVWVGMEPLIGTARHVPALFCYRDYPCEPDHVFAYADSNGLASGRSPEEAILHGLLELIERDAAGIWWFNRLRRPAVDLSGLGSKYIGRLCDYYDRIGRDLWVLDVSCDTRLPVIAAVSRRRGIGSEMITLGFGCSLEYEAAVLRALTEMNQFLPLVADSNADQMLATSSGTDARSDWFRTARIADHQHLLPNRTLPLARAGDYSRLAASSLVDCIDICLERLRDLHLDAYFVDMTRADIGLTVVKVIVPGLRHFWPRYAPGRLYDVPVELGWISYPNTEAGMNPLGVFF